MNAIQISGSVALFLFGGIFLLLGLFVISMCVSSNNSTFSCTEPWKGYAYLIGGISMIIGGVVLATMSSKPTQKIMEDNKEMKGKTLEEYKKDYLTKKKNYQSSKETADTDEGLFLEIQKKLNKLMLKKDYSLSEAVKIVAEDYNKLGINLTVDRSGNAFKINGSLSDEKITESYTDQKPTKKKEITTFCENCGKILKPEAKFCGNCGTKV